MIDIISSAFGAIAWTGMLMCYWLFSQHSNGSWTLLRSYFFLTFLSWTLLMLTNTTYFIIVSKTISGPWLDWVHTDTSIALRTLVFWPIQAYAVWSLIAKILKPQIIPAQAVDTTQIVMDSQGIIQSWNTTATAMLGWTAEEAIGQELASLLIPDDLLLTRATGEKISARTAHREGMERYRQSGEAPLLDSKYPMTTLRKDKPPLTVFIHISKHLTDRGSMFLGVIEPRPPWMS